MSIPALALDLFRSQYGLLARWQAQAELSPPERRRLYRDPSVEPATPRLVRHRAVPSTLGSQLIAPVLEAGADAALWHRSASLWWGFGRDRSPLVNIATPDRFVSAPIGRLHRVKDLDEIDLAVHRGIPIARPERVLLSLAAEETYRVKPSRYHGRIDLTDVEILAPAIRRMKPVIDHAWSLGVVDGDFIHDMLERLQRRGRAGIVVLRELLLDRPRDYVPPESRLEARFEEVIARHAGLLDRQVAISDTLGLIGRVDYRARSWPLVIEVNGEFTHTTITDRGRDDARYERLLATGMSVLVIWEYDVWQRPRDVQTIVERLLSRPDRVPTLHRPTLAPWELLDLPGGQPDHGG